MGYSTVEPELDRQSKRNETTSRNETEFKNGTYLFEPIGQIDAPRIMGLVQLLHGALAVVYDT